MGSGIYAKGGAQAKAKEGEDKNNVNGQVNGDSGSGDNGAGKHKSPNVKKNGAPREAQLSESKDGIQQQTASEAPKEKDSEVNVKQTEENNLDTNNNVKANVAMDQTGSADNAVTTTDIDNDPLNQTIGKSNTGIRVTKKEEPKKKKVMVDPTFEISLEDLDMKDLVGEEAFQPYTKRS